MAVQAYQNVVAQCQKLINNTDCHLFAVLSCLTVQNPEYSLVLDLLTFDALFAAYKTDYGSPRLLHLFKDAAELLQHSTDRTVPMELCGRFVYTESANNAKINAPSQQNNALMTSFNRSWKRLSDACADLFNEDCPGLVAARLGGKLFIVASPQAKGALDASKVWQHISPVLEAQRLAPPPTADAGKRPQWMAACMLAC